MGSGLVKFIDWCARNGYRVAFQVLRVWWFVRRPATNGAICALWYDGRVLMVRNSYRPWLTFPGGLRNNGEPAKDAALREMREEVGLEVDPAAMRHIRYVSEQRDFRQENTDLFEATLAARPDPQVDNREVIMAVMLTPREALKHRLYPIARAYLRTSAD